MQRASLRCYWMVVGQVVQIAEAVPNCESDVLARPLLTALLPVVRGFQLWFCSPHEKQGSFIKEMCHFDIALTRIHRDSVSGSFHQEIDTTNPSKGTQIAARPLFPSKKMLQPVPSIVFGKSGGTE